MISLVEQTGVQIRKVAADEWAGPCPGCGGTDRFRVWPERGRYWCRQCEKSGDQIQLLRDFHGLSYGEACARIGREPKEYTSMDTLKPRSIKGSAPRWEPAPMASPADAWTDKAEKLVEWAHNQLLANNQRLDWLHQERGIDGDAVRWFRLGYVSQDFFRQRSSWGLDDVVKGDGTLKKLWIPEGLLIPTYRGEALQRIRIRRDQGEPRYYVLPGSCTEPMMISGGHGRAFVVVESELDGLLLASTCSDLTGVVALGNSSSKPDTKAAAALNAASIILVALDSDDAGAKAARWWLDHFPQAKRWPVIKGKDPADAWSNGLDLREWIRCGLPDGLRLLNETPPAEQIETERANRRQESTLKQNATVPENLPEPLKGDARDIAAEKVGMSGRTAETYEGVSLSGRPYAVLPDLDQADDYLADNPDRAVLDHDELKVLDGHHEETEIALLVKSVFGAAEVLSVTGDQHD